MGNIRSFTDAITTRYRWEIAVPTRIATRSLLGAILTQLIAIEDVRILYTSCQKEGIQGIADERLHA